MEHAWLDSLSEDWVSQPRSDDSIAQIDPAPKPDFENRRSSVFRKSGSGSRIPRPSGTPSAHDESVNVLAERSLSYINMTAPRREQRRESTDLARPQWEKSRYLSQSGSSGTTSSIVHNTVNQRSPSASPSKRGSTPEWKRRLVYGDLAYGEQRDLFCSAAADGLEGIFKPPPEQNAEDPFVEEDSRPNETTLPSSPPVFRPPPHFDESEFPDDEFEAAPADVTPSPSPRKGYKEIHDLLDENSVMIESSDEFSIHQDTFQHEEYPADERYAAEDRYTAHEEYRVEDEYSAHERYAVHEDPAEDIYPAEEDYPAYEEHPIHEEHLDHEEHPAHETHPSEEEHPPAENPASNLPPPPPAENPHVLQPPQGESRKTSGQSVMNNEYFSPIYLSVHDTGDGNIGFEPTELPADQLRDRLEKVQENRMLLNSTLGEDVAQDVQTDSYAVAQNVDSTEDYMRNGGFLNLRRGGDSVDGSFRYRLLSPSLGNDSSEMLPDQSLQASTPKQFPTVRNGLGGQPRTFDGSPLLPRAPYPSPEKLVPRPHTSGGSPLKLFGPYDTFTNQTLMRRISQFEEAMSDPASDKSFETNPFRSSVDVNSRRGHPLAQERTQEERSVSHFGDGDLEGYEFGRDVSNLSAEESRLDDNPNISQQENIPPPFSPPHDSSAPDSSHLVINRQRQKSSVLTSSQHSQPVLGARLNVSDAQVYLGTPKRYISSEMKRPRTSPTKDPTPKRRRTLHKTDIGYEAVGVGAVQMTHQQMQAAMEKRRRDALSGDAQLVAEPDVLAHRQILRPRTPTPSQRSSLQRDTVPSYGDLSVGGKPKRSPLRNMNSSGRQSAASGDTDRKPSIKTQDFLDEAAQIMAMIRNQVRPTNLASVEEAEEHGFDDGDHGDDDSYEEPFSRPPSREGAPVTRMPARQEDPEILDRLKKYQEMSDMGDVITSSLRSMSLARDAILETREMEREARETARTDLVGAGDEEFSDPPNIRISQGPAESNATAGVTYPTVSSQGSNRTSSSRNSECKRTIAPQSVSHLIPDQVGSMYLDRNENRWVKKRARAARRMSETLREESDDDPFASIPDLSVDMTEEMRNLKIAKEQEQQAAEEEEAGMSPSSSPFGSPPGRVQGYATLTPDQDADDAVSRAMDEISKLEVKASTSPTREEEVEREISIDEGRHTPQSRRRNLTISFSSPVASFIRDVLPEDLNELSEDEDYTPELPGDHGHTLSGKGTWQRPSPVNRRKGSRGYVRQPSGGRVSFLRRTVSRIEERDEESTPADPEAEDRQLSLLGENSALEQATPAPRRRGSLNFVLKGPAGEADSSVIGQNVGNLSLSPLSEFTMHNTDRSSYGLEVSYVMDRRRLVSGDGSRKVMSLGIRELVDRLTEAEPSEPFWDGLSALDLRDKRLSSLHKLDEFCGALVSLDASENALTHLDGVPSCVRQLKVCGNMLSELTSWDHLANLQYVDVSGNDLRSLSALKHLVHLRSVRADDNLLTGLDGIDELDGLLTLRARNNQIEELDFEGTGLQRLSELDVGGNKITSVRNIECLTSLSTLKLQRNQLESFSCARTFPSLRYLDLSDNALHALDLTRVPKLRLLHADRNKLTSIAGLAHARHIDSLSLREQRGEQPLDVPAVLSTAYEVRKLFLSGNYVGALEPRIDMLNLQLLELASCGLRALPQGMGQMMPNLRSLNICFNAVTELGPLRFVPRLKRLLAAGNRLADGTGIMSVVGEFPHLREVDLRDNPLTLGFYPPSQVLVSTESEVLQSVEGFKLPHADPERDGRFRGRLDEATRLRRRLYEIIFASGCVKLRILDGLELMREEALGQDEAMDRLVQEGLIPGEGHEDIPEVVEEGDAVKVEVVKDEPIKGEVVNEDADREEKVEEKTVEDEEAQAEQAHDEENQGKEERTASETEVESCAQENGDDEGDTSRWPAEDSFA